MNRMSVSVVVASLAVALASAGARAGIVGVDVSGATYTGPGVLDTSSRTWVSAPSTGNTFLLDGQTITMTYGTNSAGGANATIDLFDDYKHNGGSGFFGVVLTGLDLNKTYDIVIYGAQNFLGGRGGLFRIEEGDGGLNQSASTTGDQQASFVLGVNYVKFTGLVPDNTLNDARIRWTVRNGPDGIGIFNGFEVRAVPAPAALPAGLAMLAVVGMRRRRR